MNFFLEGKGGGNAFKSATVQCGVWSPLPFHDPVDAGLAATTAHVKFNVSPSSM